jgi:hypothetical protein
VNLLSSCQPFDCVDKSADGFVRVKQRNGSPLYLSIFYQKYHLILSTNKSDSCNFLHIIVQIVNSAEKMYSFSPARGPSGCFSLQVRFLLPVHLRVLEKAHYMCSKNFIVEGVPQHGANMPQPEAVAVTI